MNRTDLLAAICLVFVIEGLFLMVAPEVWKRMATEMLGRSDRFLRVFGAAVVVVGLVALQVMRTGVF